MTTQINAVADFAPGIRMHHATRAKAARLAAAFLDDYPMFTLEAIEGDEIDHETFTHECGGFTVTHVDNDEGPIYEGDKVPDLADITETAMDLGLSLESDDEEEGKGGSVVPEEYRIQYKEQSSNGQTCGDWLAEFLVAQTHSSKGFEVERFTTILNNNGLDMSAKWAQLPYSGQSGWVGRYRMNGRQVLERIVAVRGWVFGEDSTEAVKVPTPDLAILRQKHEKWMSKLASKAAKETEEKAAA